MFEGPFVSDQSSNGAVFEELPSQVPLVSALKMIGIMCLQDDWAIQQSEAQQADAQSDLKGASTCMIPPRDQWPKCWGPKCRNPVVRLRLALYGHPLPGAFL